MATLSEVGYDPFNSAPVNSTAIQNGDVPPFGNATARMMVTDGSYKDLASLPKKMGATLTEVDHDPFAAPAPVAATPVAAPAPASSMLSNFGEAVLHNLQKPFHGTAQLIENGVAAGAKLLPDNPVSRAIISTAAKDNAAQQAWEQQYQASVPDNAASYTGAVVGQVLPFVASGLSSGLQTAGDTIASLVPSAVPKIIPKIVSGAAQGALVGATTPVDNGANFWDAKAGQVKSGAAIGATIPAVAGAVSGTWNSLKNAAAPIINPKSVVKSSLERWNVDPAALDATQLVPGSLPTTAQVAANPEIVQAEKALANNPAYKGQFMARNIANNDARLQAINGVAQTPADLEAAIAARKSAMEPLQDALLKNGTAVDAGPVLAQLQSLSQSALGVRPAIGGAANDIAAQIQKSATTDPATGKLTISPDHLDVIRQNVKDYLAKHTPNGAVGSQEQAAFEPVRGAIVDAIEGANPGYRDYLAQYAKLSEPINTMEAGQSILGNLGDRDPNASGAPQVNLTAFNGQLKKALGGKYGIAPDAQAALEGVQSDLQRSAISNSVRAPGSDTAYNLQAPGWLGQQLYGTEFQGGKVVPGLLGALSGAAAFTHGAGITGTGGAIAAGAYAGKKLSDFASQRVNNALAEALLNPDVAQQILTQQASPSRIPASVLARIPQASLLLGNAAVNDNAMTRAMAARR